MSLFTAAELQKASHFLWSWTWNMNKSEETSSFANHINYRITEQRPQKSKNRKSVGLFALTVHSVPCLVHRRRHRSLIVDPENFTLPQRSSRNMKDGSGKWLPKSFPCFLFWQIILTLRQTADVWHNWSYQTDALIWVWLFLITFLQHITKQWELKIHDLYLVHWTTHATYKSEFE